MTKETRPNSPTEEELISLKQTGELLAKAFHKLWFHKWKLLFFNAIVAFGCIGVLKYTATKRYQCTVEILPDFGGRNASPISQLGGLAAIAGVNIGENVNPLIVYNRLLTSEAVLEPVINQKYYSENSKDSVSLMDLLNIPKEGAENASVAARKRFLIAYATMVGGVIQTNPDRTTGTLSLIVQTTEAQLSADIANAVAASLDNYLKNKRNSSVKEQAKYLGIRSVQLEDSLRKAEDALKRFRDQNRIVVDPQLMLVQGRLLRKVELFQSVYQELAKQKELTKLAEIQDSPVLNIKELGRPNYNPVRSNSRTRFIEIMLLSLIISSVYLLRKDRS